MSYIFSAAELVIAWLGLGCEDSLQYLESHEFKDWCRSPALHLGHLPEPAEKFLSLPYWSRLWVQQELVLANDVVFMTSTLFTFAVEIFEMQHAPRVKTQPALLRA